MRDENMASEAKKEFLQNYKRDSYSRAVPSKVISGKTASLGEYSEPVDTRKTLRAAEENSVDYKSDLDHGYAQPQDAVDVRKVKSQKSVNDKEDADVYELAQQPADDYDVPPRSKPSPKPRASKHGHINKQDSKSFLGGEGRGKGPSSSLDQSEKEVSNPYRNISMEIPSSTQSPRKRPSKKVVEIEYEVASAIRPSKPGEPSSARSAHDPGYTNTMIVTDSKTVPTYTSSPVTPLKVTGNPLFKASDSATVLQSLKSDPNSLYSMSKNRDLTEGGPENFYEEPWDLKVRRLKQEQEKKENNLEVIPVGPESKPMYKDARDTPLQRRPEKKSSYARSISENSEADIFHDALDNLPNQKIQNQPLIKDPPANLQPLPANTYEDAWDLKNSILELKIREMQMQASATYEEPWDLKRQQRSFPGKSQSAIPGKTNNDEMSHRQRKTNNDEMSHRQRSSSDAYDHAWEGGDARSSFVRGKFHSSDESKMKMKSRGCNIGQSINPMIPLVNQNWYHGNISRDDAEKMLCVCKEGSYIVRISSDRKSYSLSIKSAKQYIHVQIEQISSQDGTIRYILGKNSKNFCSIPEMIDYYTHHRVPLRGAEHITLLHPVECKWS